MQLSTYSLELLQDMPCPFTGPRMFCAGPNSLSQPKTLIAFSASPKTFAPAQKPILLNANHLFVWHKMFVTATIYLNRFLTWHQKIGPAKNILGPVKGQGITLLMNCQIIDSMKYAFNGSKITYIALY